MLNTVKRRLIGAAALASVGVILYGVFLPSYQAYVWLRTDVWVALPSEYLLRKPVFVTAFPNMTIKADPPADEYSAAYTNEPKKVEFDATRQVLSVVPSLQLSWPWLTEPHSWLGVHRIVTACLRFPISLLMVVIWLTCFIYSAVKLDQWTRPDLC